jgi:hypothetical protein
LRRAKEQSLSGAMAASLQAIIPPTINLEGRCNTKSNLNSKEEITKSNLNSEEEIAKSNSS